MSGGAIRPNRCGRGARRPTARASAPRPGRDWSRAIAGIGSETGDAKLQSQSESDSASERNQHLNGAALLLARGWKERLGNLELYER